VKRWSLSSCTIALYCDAQHKEKKPFSICTHQLRQKPYLQSYNYSDIQGNGKSWFALLSMIVKLRDSNHTYYPLLWCMKGPDNNKNDYSSVHIKSGKKIIWRATTSVIISALEKADLLISPWQWTSETLQPHLYIILYCDAWKGSTQVEKIW
jgi:hypothetical protein